MSHVGIIGQGYVGLALSEKIASAGHYVVGYDNNKKIVSDLKAGISHIEDVTNHKLRELISGGKYLAVSDPSQLRSCEIIIIAVPTPLDEFKKPDLKFINGAIDIICDIFTNEILIINESTSYPGTLRNEIASKILAKTRINHKYVAAPERIDPGNIKYNVKNTPRVLSGITKEATRQAMDFYKSFTDSVIEVTSPEVAETAKLVENSFRQINIAFVNELSQLTKALDLSIYEVLDAAATKPYGFMKFSPGAGVGGHCIPVDPIYLNYSANQVGLDMKLISLADQINSNMVNLVIDRISKDFDGKIASKRICVIGLAYKPDTADIRESASIKLINRLKELGVNVSWHDEGVKNWCGEISQPLTGCDIAILVTKHKSFDVEALNDVPYIFDCTGNIKNAKSL
jgi:UDP-N-acetyl-D-glucosamine dehydrogenase